MDILVIGDLHGDTVKIEDIPDVAIQVGDISNYGELEVVEGIVYNLVAQLDPVPLLVIPGNHDIYGHDSLKKLEEFNKTAKEAGAIPLMEGPLIIDEVGFVGVMGGYDYSFAPEYLNLPKEAYRVKAFGLRRLEDAEYINLPFSDEEFLEWNLKLLKRFIREIREDVSILVLVMHFAPFKESLKCTGNPEIDYFATYMGSKKLGELALKLGADIVVHGHTHRRTEYLKGGTRVVSVGLRETMLVRI